MNILPDRRNSPEDYNNGSLSKSLERLTLSFLSLRGVVLLGRWVWVAFEAHLR